MAEQLSIFDVAPATPTKKPKAAAPVRPHWTSNATKATCYDCIAELAAGQFVTPMRAQWRRTLGDTIALYCYGHATPRRDADEAETRRLTHAKDAAGVGLAEDHCILSLRVGAA